MKIIRWRLHPRWIRLRRRIRSWWKKYKKRGNLIFNKELQPLLAEANELREIIVKSVISPPKGERNDFDFCTLQFSF